MAKTVAVIGVEPAELTVVRSLLAMLRHPHKAAVAEVC